MKPQPTRMLAALLVATLAALVWGVVAGERSAWAQILATTYGSMRLSDGSAFYKAFGSGEALAAGTNNIGDVDIASAVPGTGATNLGKAEDGAAGDGDTAVAALGVRNDGGSTQSTGACLLGVATNTTWMVATGFTAP